MQTLLIMLDGVGLGDNHAEMNPLVRYAPPFLFQLLKQPLSREMGSIISATGCMVPTDATLGVDGLPQSATGQTALFTGINAPAVMKRHIQAFPGPALARIISQYGIMKVLKEKGYKVTSANMYTPGYFELVEQRKRRHSVTTLTILGAGETVRSLAQMTAGQAVYQDITNEMLSCGKMEIPVITPAVAGRRLVEIARQHHFTMFEYFQTDRCGHKQDWTRAQIIIRTLDEFFAAIRQYAPEDMLVIITSDHGNFEDLSIKTHTRNAVPTILFGKQCCETAERIAALTDITPAIVAVLERNEGYD